MFYEQLFERYILFQEVDIIEDIKYLVIKILYDISSDFEKNIINKVETIVQRRCIPGYAIFYIAQSNEIMFAKLTQIDNRIGLRYYHSKFDLIVKYIIDNYLYHDLSYIKNRLICDFDDAFKDFVKSPLNIQRAS